MKTASVRQLRTEFPKMLSWLHAGEEIAITRRRKVVARLSPAGEPPKVPGKLPNFAARRKKIFGKKVIPAKVMAEILDENKGRY